MKDILKDILDMDGVNGVIIFSDEGEIIFKEIGTSVDSNPEGEDWSFLINDIKGYREVELIYGKGRIYIRKTEFGFLLVIMDLFVQVAMIRLNCDIILPALQSMKTNKKFKKYFKK